jgi:hypothetical protein
MQIKMLLSIIFGVVIVAAFLSYKSAVSFRTPAIQTSKNHPEMTVLKDYYQ